MGQQRLDESISSFKNAITFRPKLAGMYTHNITNLIVRTRIPGEFDKTSVFISCSRKPRRRPGTGAAARRGERRVPQRRAPGRPTAERPQISRERPHFSALPFGPAAAGTGAAAARAAVLAAGQGSNAQPLPATGVCSLIFFHFFLRHFCRARTI